MKILVMLFALVWLPFVNTPENVYKVSKTSKVSIAGTSTLHDWVMDSKEVNGKADIKVSGNEILTINEVVVEIPVESLKSGKSAMDKNAYAALNSDKYPTITFQLKGFDKISQNNGKAALEVRGNLTIAGKTRVEKVLVNYKTDAHGNLSVNGSKAIKMTDYGVTPPEVMFGTIKTGDDITIHFDLNLAQNTNL